MEGCAIRCPVTPYPITHDADAVAAAQEGPRGFSAEPESDPMMMTFWFFALMLLILMAPVGYGWGYRGWGPPYPSYVQRRRGQRAAATGGVTFNHESWGVGGDILWGLFLIGAFWACFVFLWR
jgi:hypothetical protein